MGKPNLQLFYVGKVWGQSDKRFRSTARLCAGGGLLDPPPGKIGLGVQPCKAGKSTFIMKCKLGSRTILAFLELCRNIYHRDLILLPFPVLNHIQCMSRTRKSQNYYFINYIIEYLSIHRLVCVNKISNKLKSYKVNDENI